MASNLLRDKSQSTTEPGKEHEWPCELKFPSQRDGKDPTRFAQIHPGFLSSAGSPFWAAGFLVVGHWPVHWRVVRGVAGLCPPDAGSASHPSCYNPGCTPPQPQTLPNVPGATESPMVEHFRHREPHLSAPHTRTRCDALICRSVSCMSLRVL